MSNEPIFCAGCKFGIYYPGVATSQKMHGWESLDLALLLEEKSCKTGLFCKDCAASLKQVKHLLKILNFILR